MYHSITQVIDLLEGLRCLPLPLLCERIVEVPIRDWLVAPALQKDGRHCVRRDPTLGRDQGEEANAGDLKATRPAPCRSNVVIFNEVSPSHFRGDEQRGTAGLREHSLFSQTSPRTDEPHRSEKSSPGPADSGAHVYKRSSSAFPFFSVPGETEEVCAVTILLRRNPGRTQLL